MSLAPLCRVSHCKKCGAFIDYMLDYCGEDYFDASKNGKCENLARKPRKSRKKHVRDYRR